MTAKPSHGEAVKQEPDFRVRQTACKANRSRFVAMQQSRLHFVALQHYLSRVATMALLTQTARSKTMTDSASTRTASLVVRRLWPTETALFREHFNRLDNESRILRFGGFVHDTLIDNYVRSAMSGDGLVYGAFVDGELRGVGEIRISTTDYPWRAEAAFSVEPDWQHKGLGDALMERIIAVARNRSISGLDMWCRASNHNMRRLADKHGADIEFTGDEAHGTLKMPFPTPVTMLEEVLGEAIGLGGLFASFASLPGTNGASGRGTNLASAA
jgi:GNAT superfamily N-acetyltransferase